MTDFPWTAFVVGFSALFMLLGTIRIALAYLWRGGNTSGGSSNDD